MTDGEPPAAEKSGSLLTGTAIVGGLTAGSRLLGFVRDLLMARLFGASLAADMFFVAFRIPNTLRSFFAEGALTSAFIPVFAEELEADRSAALRFYRNALGTMLGVTGLVALLLFLWAEEVVLVFAPGFAEEPEQLLRTAQLLQVMLPYLPSISLVVLINGVLTTLHRYGAGAIAQVSVNLCLIIGTLLAGFAPEGSQVEVVAWSVCSAAVIQYLILFPLARASGFPPIPKRPRWTPPLRKMSLLMIPALLGAAVYQLTILLNTVLASFLPTGSIAWLFYADRIAQLPIGVFTIALSSVLLPQLARGHARGDSNDPLLRLHSAFRYSLYCLTPLAAVLSVAAPSCIATLFERGEFTSSDTVQAARALRWYALGLVPLSLYSVLSRHFIAQKKTAIPAAIGGVVLCSSFLFSLTLMGPIAKNEGSGIASLLTVVQNALPLRWS
ncbi:murein biosynthesis integral membrane protein MurJ, partial [bacterium]|nr:murein biosynthesis integral membrane protein MurJ [bacterium]